MRLEESVRSTVDGLKRFKGGRLASEADSLTDKEITLSLHWDHLKKDLLMFAEHQMSATLMPVFFFYKANTKSNTFET